MLDGMPWPAQIGMISGGYVGFVTMGLWVVRAFLRGDIFPKRTVEILETRNATQEETIKELTGTVASLQEGTALANTLMKNLNDAVVEARDVEDR